MHALTPTASSLENSTETSFKSTPTISPTSRLSFPSPDLDESMRTIGVITGRDLRITGTCEISKTPTCTCRIARPAGFVADLRIINYHIRAYYDGSTCRSAGFDLKVMICTCRVMRPAGCNTCGSHIPVDHYLRVRGS
jgi:hypothetical protein